MPLLSYDPMEDGNAASANLWNVRLSKIHDLFNGNLDAANLANGAVTTPKIADGAVTSSKISTNKYTDDNGWVVNDMGTFKTYTYTMTISGLSVPGGSRVDSLTPILPPVGRTNDNLIYSTAWFGSYSGHAVVGVEKSGQTPNTSDDANPTGNYIAVMFANQHTGAALPFTGKVFITAVEA